MLNKIKYKKERGERHGFKAEFGFPYGSSYPSCNSPVLPALHPRQFSRVYTLNNEHIDVRELCKRAWKCLRFPPSLYPVHWRGSSAARTVNTASVVMDIVYWHLMQVLQCRLVSNQGRSNTHTQLKSTLIFDTVMDDMVLHNLLTTHSQNRRMGYHFILIFMGYSRSV